MVAQFGEKLILVQKAILIEVGLLDELQNVVVADIDIQVLVEDGLDFVEAHQPPFLPVEQSKHVQSLFFPSSAEEPLFGDEIDDFRQTEGVFVLVGGGYFVLDLLPVHLGVGEVAENAPEVLAVDVARVAGVVEGEGVLDFVLLNRARTTMSTVSLLLTLAFLPPFW